MTLKEYIAKYEKEFQEDVIIDQVTVMDTQTKLPGIKGKWSAKIMYHKADLIELEDIREEKINNLRAKIKEESQVVENDIVYLKKAEKHELIEKINKEIRTQQNVITYLEKLEKIIGNTTYDIKNICELNKT